jgi:hypothetical protein
MFLLLLSVVTTAFCCCDKGLLGVTHCLWFCYIWLNPCHLQLFIALLEQRPHWVASVISLT